MFGLAPTAVAAGELADSIGARADTLAKLVWDLEHETLDGSHLDGIDSESLVIVDEAGMASTPDLAKVVAFASSRGATVRLIGDDQQLAAIGAGGALRDIAATSGALTLNEVVRFRTPGESEASLALRQGRSVEALGFYLDQSRARVTSPMNALDDIYSAWSADRNAGMTNHPSTGQIIRMWATTNAGARDGDPVVTGYDSWGRTTSYIPSPGETTTTHYDTAGRVATVTDPKGTHTYGYDGDDADGRAERRGLATSLTVSRASDGDLTFTGAYGPDGTLEAEKLPGGVTRRSTFDTAGQQNGLTYSGHGVDPATGPDPDTEWLAWTLDNDILGRVAHETTPTVGASGDTSLSYRYDRAGRLRTVIDRAMPHAITEGTETEIQFSCQVRTYEFDRNGNRTSLTRTNADPGADCATTGGTTTTWNYDTADRITGGYVYGALGRATTIPAGDTPSATAGATSPGALTVTHDHHDQARTISQGTTTTSISLDQSGRRLVEATGPTGSNPTKTLTRHYADGGDSPAWVTEATADGTDTIRYITGLGGGLVATVSTGAEGTQLTAIDPHGDTPATITLPATGPAQGIDAWADTDEYGNPHPTANDNQQDTSTAGVGYGWLGAHQRATTDSGLFLMGVRLYNPVTGQFTSTDPIVGRNATAYSYPADPINFSDISGMSSFFCYCGGGLQHIGGGKGFGKLNLLQPGPYAKNGVPVTKKGKPTAAQQKGINKEGYQHGCHSCGTKNPGTKSGNFIGDHQDPTAINKLKPKPVPQTYYPHCPRSSKSQGGQVEAAADKIRKGKKPPRTGNAPGGTHAVRFSRW